MAQFTATMDELRKEEKRNFLIFVVGWILILVFNKALGDCCWFFSEEAGEYSVAELASLVFYLAAVVVFVNIARIFKNKWYYCPAAFVFLLFLEEGDYGQILLNKSETNYYYDSEQFSLHTALLRPVHFAKHLDLSDLAEIGLIIAVTLAGPMVLKRKLKINTRAIYLWIPAILIGACYVANYAFILVPWECGRDSFEELIETILAASVFYLTALIEINLEKNVVAAENSSR